MRTPYHSACHRANAPCEPVISNYWVGVCRMNLTSLLSHTQHIEHSLLLLKLFLLSSTESDATIVVIVQVRNPCLITLHNQASPPSPISASKTYFPPLCFPPSLLLSSCISHLHFCNDFLSIFSFLLPTPQ